MTLENLNLYYESGLSPEMEYNHDLDYDNDYCRCGTIVGIKKRKPNSYNIADRIIEYHKGIKLSDIQKYAIERWANLLTHEDFNITSERGYYGDEVGKMTLNSSAITTLERLLDSSDPIGFTLNLEYPNHPNLYSNKKWVSQPSVKISLVDCSLNTKLNSKTLDYYNLFLHRVERFTILCIAKPEGHFGLIDGRHRLEILKGKNKRLVDIIYCEK